MTPSDLLQAAADRIRDLAAEASRPPWEAGPHLVAEADDAMLAALSLARLLCPELDTQ